MNETPKKVSNGVKVFIAGDHAGFSLKEKLVPFLKEKGYVVEDCGAFSYVEGDDYPDVVTPCAKRVAETPGSFGIVIGASGQGEAMAANRVAGVRSAVFYGDAHEVQVDAEGNTLSLLASAREHNDANVLSLGARFLSEEEAKQAVITFLSISTSSDERHVRRRAKLG